MRPAITLLLMLAGCDRVFNLESIATEGTDAGARDGDTAPDGGNASDAPPTPSFCAAPQVFDGFDDLSNPCNIGASNNPAALTESGGMLNIALAGDDLALAGCTAFNPLTLTENGVYLHVPNVATETNAYTVLKIRNSLGSTPDLEATLVHRAGVLSFLVGRLQYAALTGAPPWWRVRRQQTSVTADYSYDGTEWTLLASVATDVTTTINVDIGIGLAQANGVGATGSFGEFAVCN